MQCKADNNLQICQSCRSSLLETLQQKQQQYAALKVKIQNKIKSIDMHSVYEIQSRQRKKLQRRNLLQKVMKMRKIVDEERKKAQLLKEKEKQVEKQVEDGFYVQQFQVQKQYLNTLVKRNQNIQKQIILQKSKRKQILQKIMNVCEIQKKKYKMQKYFKTESIEHVGFRIDVETNQIPILQTSCEQIIVYRPLQNKQDMQLRNEQKQIRNILKLTVKLITVIHRVFFPQVRLPYKLFFLKDCFYFGNLLITFKTTDLRSDKMKRTINMIQADIQFLRHLTGFQSPVFLILDQDFLNKLEKKQYKFNAKANNSVKKNNQYLKYLGIDAIQSEHQEQNDLLQLQTEQVLMSMSIRVTKSQSDEDFQIL